MAQRFLTPLQRRRIQQTIRDGHLAFLAEMFGPTAIDADDFARLRATGKIREEKLLPQDIAFAAHALGSIAGEATMGALAQMSHEGEREALAQVHGLSPQEAARVFDIDDPTKYQKLVPDAFWRQVREDPQVITDAEHEAITLLRDRIGQHVRGLSSRFDTNTGKILVDADDKLRRRRLTKIQREVTRGVEERSTAQEVARHIRNSTKDLKRDWLRTAHTEMHNAVEEAKAIVLAHRSADRDPRVFKRPHHDACFPPGVYVTTVHGDVPIEHVHVGDLVLTHKLRWRRVTHTHVTAYDDDLVTVRAGEFTVPMTRNHPVLSGMNWRDAETLQNGDDVISLVGVRHPHDEPAALTEQTVPLAMELPVVPAASSVQLHRDLLVRDSQIDVEFVNCVLRHEGIRTQGMKHLLGILSHHGSRSLFRLGLTPKTSWGMCQRTSLARTLGDLFPLIVGHLFVAESERFAKRAEAYASTFQPTSDGPAAYAVFGGDGIGVLPTLVGADDVFDRQVELDRHHATVYATTQRINATERRHYSGLVYNLAVEEDESFFAGGLAVHNCAFCVLLYLRPDKATPRVFRLSELLSNGTNVNRKANRPSKTGKSRTEWRATIGAIHPFCRCALSVLPPGMGFNARGQMTYVGMKKSIAVESLDKALADHECSEE